MPPVGHPKYEAYMLAKEAAEKAEADLLAAMARPVNQVS